MAEIARWNEHVFVVEPGLIRGFTGLSIKGSSETEDKTSSNQKYVKRKNGKPNEITLTAVLNAATGCDVQNEAMAFVDEARAGKKDYFYVATKKLCACKLMLTDATVKEISMTNNGVWTRAEVALTLKQCDKNGSGSTSTKKKASSSSKKSVKKSVKKTGTTSKPLTKMAEDIRKAASKTQNVNKAVQAIKKITTAAKKVTATKITRVRKGLR